MAKGDAIVEITDLAAGATLIFQPAAGVEAVIVEAFTESRAADMRLYIVDGVLLAGCGADSARWSGKLFINNSAYLQLLNGNTGPMSLVYTGVQVK